TADLEPGVTSLRRPDPAARAGLVGGDGAEDHGGLRAGEGQAAAAGCAVVGDRAVHDLHFRLLDEQASAVDCGLVPADGAPHHAQVRVLADDVDATASSGSLVVEDDGVDEFDPPPGVDAGARP